MSKTDELIERALSAEDRELLARHAEPGYFAQAAGLFRGSLGWVAGVAYASALVAFAGFGYAFWRMWTADDVLYAIKFAALALVLFQFTMMVKTFLGAQLESHRALREIKRVELQVAMLREAQASPKR
ncbi:MAG: hypothetical protein E6Q88_14260 [Lysobacteraceae bacterium]|nr:MAG: hypothetical protein E6Q88_14260 [Xanthomonadaceae bacterium]